MWTNRVTLNSAVTSLFAKGARRSVIGVAQRFMKSNSPGFSEGGESRLRTAIEEQVRREFQEELSDVTEHWAKVAVEDKIQMEIKKRINRVASPQSLWGMP